MVSGRGAGGFGITTKRVDVVWSFNKDDKGQIREATTELTHLDNSTKRYTTTVRDENNVAIAMRETTATSIPSMRNMTMHIQAMNMQFLGITMSLLGFSFALRQSGLVSDETMDSIMKVIGPIQMTISVINMATSMWGLYSLMQQHAAMVSATSGATMVSSNTALGSSYGWVAVNIWRVWAAMGAISLIFAGLLTDIPALRAALWGLAAVLGVIAFWNIQVAVSEVIKKSFSGPPGWLQIAIGAGIAAAGIGVVAGLWTASKGIGLWRGGVIDRPISMGEIGTEMAVAPLYSSRGRKFISDSQNGGVYIDRVIVESDRPSTFARKMDSGLRRRKFLAAKT